MKFDVSVNVSIGCTRCVNCRTFPTARVRAGEYYPEYALPQGWSLLNGDIICDRHQVTVIDPLLVTAIDPLSRRV